MRNNIQTDLIGATVRFHQCVNTEISGKPGLIRGVYKDSNETIRYIVQLDDGKLIEYASSALFTLTDDSYPA